MVRKLSLLLTVAAALGLAVAISSCGKKGGLELPPAEASAPTTPSHTA